MSSRGYLTVTSFAWMWNWGNDETFSTDMSSEKGTLKKLIDFVFWEHPRFTKY